MMGCLGCRKYWELGGTQACTHQTSITIPLTNPDKETNLNEYTKFETKDSGERQIYETGMMRDTQTDKPRYDLVDWDMIKRWAELMGRGAIKYGEHNWKKAATVEELNRFKSSGLRHMIQFFNGDTDEDHGAAVYFNVAGAEMVRRKLEAK